MGKLTLASAAAVVAASTLFAAGPGFAGDEVQTFILKNDLKPPVTAYDVTVVVDQKVVKAKDNSTKGGMGPGFGAPTISKDKMTLTYGPKKGVTVQSLGTFKFDILAPAGTSVDLTKSRFTDMDGDALAGDPTLVSANIGLTMPGGTAVVTVSNPTSEYQFFSSFDVWTNLTPGAADNDGLNWQSPGTTPSLVVPNFVLAPGATDTINLGPESPSTSYLVLYQFADGPDSSPSDAATEGVASFAESVAVPEPAAWTLLLFGAAATGAALRRRSTALRAGG